jgi:hypothetical protein
MVFCIRRWWACPWFRTIEDNLFYKSPNFGMMVATQLISDRLANMDQRIFFNSGSALWNSGDKSTRQLKCGWQTG